MTDWSYWSNQNRISWNKRVPIHMASEFYDLQAFLDGGEVLKEPELDLLPNVRGKRLLHLQCHFGQDTLAWERHGAIVTGVDISDVAIQAANELATRTHAAAKFICSDIYALNEALPPADGFDIVFASYGAICWLNDLDTWARLAYDQLAKGGKLVLVDFHPTLYLFDFGTASIDYPYFPHTSPLTEETSGSYAAQQAQESFVDNFWTHPISEILGAILGAGFTLSTFREWDYSPYPCFPNMNKISDGKWRWGKTTHPLPHVFGLSAIR